jgi:ligand-binding sensor domain-containing protein
MNDFRLLIVGFFIFYQLTMLANVVDPRFYHLTIDQGLSDNIVQCFHQDSKGFLWIGSHHGLNRYDGNTILNFKHRSGDETTIRGNVVRDIAEDRSGNLWVGTIEGINVLDITTNRVFKYDSPSEQSFIRSNVVNELHCDCRGLIWVGTVDGLLIYNIDDKLISIHDDSEYFNSQLSHLNIQSIVEDRNGDVWIGTENGLNKIIIDRKQVIKYYHESHGLNSIPNNDVSTVFVDSRNNLWVGSSSGNLKAYAITEEDGLRSIQLGAISKKIDSSILALEEDNDGRIWIASRWSGLFVFNRTTMQFQHYMHNPKNPFSLSWNVLFALYKTNCGSIWIGTFGTGCDIWHPSFQNFRLYQLDDQKKDEITLQSINAIVTDLNDRIWVSGYEGRGTFNIIDRDKGITEINYGTEYSPITSFHLDKDKPNKYMWFGSRNKTRQLHKFDINKSELIRSYQLSVESQHVYHIKEKNGILWIATSDGLYELKKDSNKVIRHDLYKDNDSSEKVSHIYDIELTDYPNLWLATNQGLFHYNTISLSSELYANKPDDLSSLSSDRVFELLIDSKGNLWAGTDNGLNRFNELKRNFKHFNTENGLSSNLIMNLQEDNEGNIWISSNRGLSKKIFGEDNFIHYQVEDGLQSNDFSLGAGYCSPNGELFFGGTKGLNSFFSKKLRSNDYKAPVCISNMSIFNKDVQVFDTISHNKPLLTTNIEYADEIQISY